MIKYLKNKIINFQILIQFIELGRIVSIEINHKPIDIARKGSEVCIKIEPVSGEAPKMFGRHFDENDFLMSKVTKKNKFFNLNFSLFCRFLVNQLMLLKIIFVMICKNLIGN